MIAQAIVIRLNSSGFFKSLDSITLILLF
ncbi:hypothetical protein BC952_3114 [Flavobacterium limicola]|uniref:Uncharacterized protein n=1 Tax=Flavobacterium limicola TaxID=180441 RepID=A0A495RQW7_9FLAO|nr:hypothetical protein BC952_3114 [Flavobacterium limicola]